MAPLLYSSSKLRRTPDLYVEKMKLSRDKTQVKYNDYLTLDWIPSRAFDYCPGKRLALEWVIDQYRVKTDKCSDTVQSTVFKSSISSLLQLPTKPFSTDEILTWMP